MLDRIRNATDSTFIRIMLGVVLFTFLFWGVGGSNDAPVDSSIVATVNGESITRDEFMRVYRGALRQANATSDEQQLQIKAQVEQELIKQEALLQEAARLGLYVSEEEVRRNILKDEAFASGDESTGKKFDEKLYKQRLRNAGYSEGSYAASVRRDLLFMKMMTLIGEGVTVSDEEAFAWYKRRQTQVDLQFVRLSPPNFLNDITVTDAERDAFATANAAKIEERYNRDLNRFYDIPRRYQLRMILLRSDIGGDTPEAEAAAKTALAKKAAEIQALAAGGADFADLAKRYSEDLTASSGGGLGMRPGAQFDAAEIAAADAAGVGKVSAVFETGRGLEILLVEKIEEAKKITLQEATPDIATNLLKEERVGKTVAEFAGNLISAWTQAGPPADQLLPRNLVVETTGPFALGGGEIPTLGAEAEILALLPDAAPGTVFPKVFEIRGLSYVVSLASRTEPKREEFDAQKGMIRAQLLRVRQQQFFEGWSQDVVAKAEVVQY